MDDLQPEVPLAVAVGRLQLVAVLVFRVDLVHYAEILAGIGDLVAGFFARLVDLFLVELDNVIIVPIVFFGHSFLLALA